MNLAQFATTHLKALLFCCVALCLAGGLMVSGFPVAILPDVTFPRLVVIAEGGDAPARTMEITVTRPLEESVSTVAGVQRLRSTTQRGASELQIDFADGTDMSEALNLVNARLSQVRGSLPADTDVSAERMNPTVFPVMGLSLYSHTLSQTQLWQFATYQLRPRLARVPGVARVVVQGGSAPEIAVEVTPQRLAAYHLTLDDISTALASTNVVRTAGRFDRAFQQYQTLVSGAVTTPEQLGQIVVTTRGGVPLHLKDVAKVHPAAADQMTVVTAEGRESVLLNIVRQPEANSIAVAQGVKDEMRALQSTLPPGTRLGVFYDQSILVNEAITSVRDAVLIGAVLAVVVLMAFLGDWRATSVTAIIIPTTVLITFLGMRWAGLTLNLMTLGALAVGIGLVIDDAIVVVENVFRHLAEGTSKMDAVRAAAQEISAPMISSTLTTVVVFLPLMLLSGVAGAFFGTLAITLTIALLVSLILALLLSPSLCAAFLRTRPGQSEHGPLFERLLTAYERLLRVVLKHRWVLPVGAIVLLGATYSMATRLPTGFMPEMDEGAFILDYNSPPGTSLQESNRLLQQVETLLHDTPEVASYSRRTGTELGFAITEPNRGDFAVMLKTQRSRSVEAVMDEVRGKVTSQVPGLDVEFIQVLQDLIGDLSGAPSPIEIKLFGNDPQVLNATAEQVAARLEHVKGATDVVSGVVESGPELVLHVDPDKAGRVGMTADAVATQANAALFGTVATQLQQNDASVPVRVRLPASFRADPSQLGQIPITIPAGSTDTGGNTPPSGSPLPGVTTTSGVTTLPLRALGSFEAVAGTTEIEREDQRRMVGVTAGLEGSDLGTVMSQVTKLMSSQKLPAGVTYQLGGQSQSQAAAFRNLEVVLALAIALVFAVMLFQFGSFTAPLTILLVMPLALFGVALGLWITNTPLNVSSFMGAIMLVGIVVKNGILLLDHAHQDEMKGVPLERAVRQAGRARLRPILMTTLTAILGLLPLALGLGAGAEMQKPLAVAVIGGLSFSTLFTLVFVPMLYFSLRQWQIGWAEKRLSAPREVTS